MTTMVAVAVSLAVAVLVLAIIVLRQRRIIAVQDRMLNGEFFIAIGGKMHIARPVNVVTYEVTHVVDFATTA